MLETNELVSVIISTYNRVVAFKRALLSVVNQTYKNIEIIIVDDNKDILIREKVGEIVRSIDDARIFIIQNKVNLGGALSRNEGIKYSKGEYIAFLDDDDEFLPSKIEEQYNFIKKSDNKKLALVYNYVISDDKKHSRYKYHYRGNCLYEAMLDCVAATSQWFCRKEAINKVGMFYNTPCKQDSNLMIRLLAAGYEIDVVPKYLSLYHCDQTYRISNGDHKKRILGEESLRDICRSYYDLLKNKKQINMVEYSFAVRLAEHYYAIGFSNEFKKCLKVLVKNCFKKKSLAAFWHIIIAKRV